MNSKIIAAFVIACMIASTPLTMDSADLVSALPQTLTVPDDYPTINAALQNATDGDTIFVKAGAYNERLVIDKAVTLLGEDKESTIINGTNRGTVLLVKHDNVTISGFTVIYDQSPNSPKGIWMWSTRLIGIHLLSAKYCSIAGNKIMDCGGGIWLYDSSRNTIADNYLYRNDYGIRVEGSTNNLFEDNVVTGNWEGMDFISSNYNRLRGNQMTANGHNFALNGDKDLHYLNDLDTSNKVDGKPIYCWVGIMNQAVPNDAGYVVLIDCIKVSVNGLNLSDNHDGIIVVNSKDIRITNNSIGKISRGILCRNSINENIVGNNIESSTGIETNGNGTTITNNSVYTWDIGIFSSGYYQTVMGNTVNTTTSDTRMLQCYGTYTSITENRMYGTGYCRAIICGSNNLVYENVMVNSHDLSVNSHASIIARNDVPGIALRGGSDNIICANRVTDCLGISLGGTDNQIYGNHVESGSYGVSVGFGDPAYCSNNVVYHNNFVNNRQQVENYQNPSNYWDNGAEGNYWSDYTGYDGNGDGIGDTPYNAIGIVRTNESKTVTGVVATDNYPLMAPFDISSITIELPKLEYLPPESIIPLASLDWAKTVGFGNPTPEPTAPSQLSEGAPLDVVISAITVTVALSILSLIILLKTKRRSLRKQH